MKEEDEEKEEEENEEDEGREGESAAGRIELYPDSSRGGERERDAAGGKEKSERVLPGEITRVLGEEGGDLGAQTSKVCGLGWRRPHPSQRSSHPGE